MKRSYVDKGGEFKCVFLRFCNEKIIRVTMFKKLTGTNDFWVLKCFNRTMRRYLDKLIKLCGNKQLKELIPHVLDLYNRYLNNHSVGNSFNETCRKVNGLANVVRTRHSSFQP